MTRQPPRSRTIVVKLYDGRATALDAEIEAAWRHLRALCNRRTSLRRAASKFGHPVSQETRNKISEAKLGWSPTPEQRANMSRAQRARFAREGRART